MTGALVQRLWSFLLVGQVALASGCGLPRGAAIESEILRGSQTEARDIQVIAVTRSNLATIAGWPRPPQAHDTGAGWIDRGARGAGGISIAPGDRLSLTIWENDANPLMTAPEQRFVRMTDVVVSPDGTVFVPYIGEIALRGTSQAQARTILQTRIEQVLNGAQVQLDVNAGRQNTVDLVGGVARAGSYPVAEQGLSVLGLLAMGGGATEGLRNPQITLMRRDKAHHTSLAKLFADPLRDVALRGGDKVIVQEDARHFIALGATDTQATVPFAHDVVSALDAVSLMGGVAAGRANPASILILREYPARMVRTGLNAPDMGPDRTRAVFTLDLTSADGLFSARHFEIMHGDLLLVTESPVNALRTVLGLVGQTVGVGAQLN